MLVENRILFLELVTFTGDVYEGLTLECDVLIYYHTEPVKSSYISTIQIP